MTRRITCYVVFATLIWGAHTWKTERRPDMFKSNMTRNDFSNLLSSLIKLNEHRINVLKRLYYLEDYGVLSAVLRSGDEKTGNRNPSNLFLIVMSKNQTDSSQRKSGYHVVDLVTSLEVAGSNNIPKLDYVLDPASFVSQNDRKKNTLTKSIFANTPRVYKQKKTYLGDRIIKITTTKKPFQYRVAKQRKHFINKLMTPKDTFQTKENLRIEIVSENKSSNASERLRYSSKVTINDQSTSYNKIELSIKKYKLTTKPITIKDKLVRKRKKLEHNFPSNNKDIDNDRFKKSTQINGDMFTKLFLDNNHSKPETYKNISKVSESDSDSAYDSDSKVKKIDENNHPKPGIGKVIAKVTEISVKKIDDNIHPKPGTDKLTTKPITIKDIFARKRKKLEYNFLSNNKDIDNDRIKTSTQINGDMFTKLFLDNNHSKPETYKNISKVSESDSDSAYDSDSKVKKIDDNSHPKPGIGKVISKVTEISVKKIDDNNQPKPGTHKVISKVNDVSVKKIDDNSHPKPGTDKVISKVTDISVKKIDDNSHPKPGTDKVISKVNDISVKKIDDNNHPKPGTDKVISKVNDISVKKIDDNNHPKPETNQNTLKANVQGNQHIKLIRNKFNLSRLGNKTPRIETERRTTVLKNPKQIINGTVGSNKASESKHMVFNISPIQNPNLDISKDNAYADDFMADIRHKNATMEIDHGNGVPLIATDNVTTSNILARLKFPETAKNKPNRNNQNISKDNSNSDKMTTAKYLHNGNNHKDVELKKVKDYDNEENYIDGKKSNEVFTLVVTDEGKGRIEKIKELQDLQLTLNGFDQPETKTVARKTFHKCLNKKAMKLCNKSCKSAYQNVCRRMKCTSKAKRALKKECKRSCQKTFKSSKCSDESDCNRASGSDESDESYDSDVS